MTLVVLLFAIIWIRFAILLRNYALIRRKYTRSTNHLFYDFYHIPLFFGYFLVMNISLFKLKYIKINHNWNFHSHLSLNMPNAIFLWFFSLLLVAIGSLGELGTNYNINFLLKKIKSDKKYYLLRSQNTKELFSTCI